MEYKWVDMSVESINNFLLNNNYRQNIILLGWSFIFEPEKYKDIFPDEFKISNKYVRMTRYIITLLTNHGYRPKLVKLDGNYTKIQIFIENGQ